MNSSIQFTAEAEENDCLNYLDLKILKQPDGTLKFTAHRKSSYSSKILDFRSSHYISHKHSTVRSLISRAFKIFSQDLLQEELSYLKNQFINNNYPKKMVIQEIKKF